MTSDNIKIGETSPAKYPVAVIVDLTVAKKKTLAEIFLQSQTFGAGCATDSPGGFLESPGGNFSSRRLSESEETLWRYMVQIVVH